MRLKILKNRILPFMMVLSFLWLGTASLAHAHKGDSHLSDPCHTCQFGNQVRQSITSSSPFQLSLRQDVEWISPDFKSSVPFIRIFLVKLSQAPPTV